MEWARHLAFVPAHATFPPIRKNGNTHNRSRDSRVCFYLGLLLILSLPSPIAKRLSTDPSKKSHSLPNNFSSPKTPRNHSYPKHWLLIKDIWPARDRSFMISFTSGRQKWVGCFRFSSWQRWVGRTNRKCAQLYNFLMIVINILRKDLEIYISL